MRRDGRPVQTGNRDNPTDVQGVIACLMPASEQIQLKARASLRQRRRGIVERLTVGFGGRQFGGAAILQKLIERRLDLSFAKSGPRSLIQVC